MQEDMPRYEEKSRPMPAFARCSLLAAHERDAHWMNRRIEQINGHDDVVAVGRYAAGRPIASRLLPLRRDDHSIEKLGKFAEVSDGLMPP